MNAVVHTPGPVTVQSDVPEDVAARLGGVVAAAVERAMRRVPIDGVAPVRRQVTATTAPIPAAKPRPAPVKVFDPFPSAPDAGRLTGAQLLARLAPEMPRGVVVYYEPSPVEGGLIALTSPGHEARYVNLRSRRHVSAGTLTEALIMGRLVFPGSSLGVVQGPIGARHQHYIALPTDPSVADADLGDEDTPAEPLDGELRGKVVGVSGEAMQATIPGKDGEYLIRGLVTSDGTTHWRNAALAAMWFAQLAAEAARGVTELDPEVARVTIFDEIDALVDVGETGNLDAVERAAALLAGLGRDAFALVDWETKVRYVRVLVTATTWDAQERAIVEICASLETPTELDAVAAVLRQGGVLGRMLSELTVRRYELLTLVGKRFGVHQGVLTLAELAALLVHLGVLRPSLAGLVSFGPDGELITPADALMAEAQAAVDAVESVVVGLVEGLGTILTEPGKLLQGLAGLAQLAVTVILARFGYPPAQRQVWDLLTAIGSSVLHGVRGAERLGAGQQVMTQLRWRVALEAASMVIGVGEIKAAIGAVGASGRLAEVLRILLLVGRATEGVAAERTAARLVHLAELIRAERTVFASGDEVSRLIAHLPKRDVDELVRLVGGTEVREVQTLAALGGDLGRASREVSAKAEVLKGLAAKAGGLTDDVAHGFATLTGRQGVDLAAASRIVRALPEGEGVRFLAMLDRTPMRRMDAVTKADLLELAAASRTRMDAFGEFGADVFRAVVRDAGGEAGQVDRTLRAIRDIQQQLGSSGAPGFERFMQRLRRGDEGAWRVVDDVTRSRIGGLSAQVEADLAGVQRKISSGASDEQVLREFRMGERDRIAGKPVENFELGNFAHDNAELLIPESELPRGLFPEYTFRLRDGSTRRVDRLDAEGGWVYEVKPDRPEWREAGERQAQLYAAWLDIERPLGNGRTWQWKVVYYDADRLRRAFRVVGDLRKWMTP